jgi:Holliday junction DNA helicase RuvA
MIFFLKGIVQELSPTYVIIDVNGVGYYVGISLQTSNKLTLGKETFIFTQQIIREDAHLLFGFHTKEEKEMFNLLISVNGVGAVSALILLSSLDLKDIANAILNKKQRVTTKSKRSRS